MVILRNDVPLMSDLQLWENYLLKNSEPYEWANNIMIEMTAWYLQVNFRIISLDYNSSAEYCLMSYPESVNFIPVGCYVQNHFQSLVDIQIYINHKQCISCGRVFTNLKNHLYRAPLCSRSYKTGVTIASVPNRPPSNGRPHKIQWGNTWATRSGKPKMRDLFWQLRSKRRRDKSLQTDVHMTLWYADFIV